MTRRLARLA